ncbi:MAG: hypothetical protein H6R14_37 [Proteobacteria bacterium]|nr:hypothetical protein [Pseudomonadota bacterium]
MIKSPCINICQMDKENGLCIGCFRTIDEIAAWSRIDDPARARILAEVAHRRLELDANSTQAKRPENS